jgi:hypothetical protein
MITTIFLYLFSIAFTHVFLNFIKAITLKLWLISIGKEGDLRFKFYLRLLYSLLFAVKYNLSHLSIESIAIIQVEKCCTKKR